MTRKKKKERGGGVLSRKEPGQVLAEKVIRGHVNA